MKTRGNRSVFSQGGSAFLAGLLALAVLLAGPRPGQAQQPHFVLSLDADFIGGGLNLAWARDADQGEYWGVEAGLGGPFWSRMLLAGRHFAHHDGPSYETRDGARDKALIELVHAAGFFRKATDRYHWDTGGRASFMAHFDSTDDDPGIAFFLGGYTSFLYGNQWIKVGPELLVGIFGEQGSTRELGILLVPLTGRISFGW